jgi:hypothetical protein
MMEKYISEYRKRHEEVVDEFVAPMLKLKELTAKYNNSIYFVFNQVTKEYDTYIDFGKLDDCLIKTL